jgi:uncharacterized protein YraI
MRRFMLGLLVMGFLALGWIFAQAQDAAPPACAAAVQVVWTTASNACISGPVGYICNGGLPPQVEPAGPVSNALNPVGALVEVGVVQSMRTAAVRVASEGTVSAVGGGLVWLRPDSPIRFTGLLVGDVQVTNITPPDFPAWQSMLVQTAPPDPGDCSAVPYNGFVLQTPFGQPTNIAINGVSIGLNGTLLVQTSGELTIFAGLSGQSSLFAQGGEQFLRPGEEVILTYSGNFVAPIAPPPPPIPLESALVDNLPVALLDRPIALPQPGSVTTAGVVNLRVSPSTDAAVLLELPAGQVMTVLGRNTAGDWYHVRMDSGESGWLYAPLLVQNIGTINAVYEATPLPLQRYGELGSTGVVVAPGGVNLRQAPDVTFPAVASVPDGARVTLIARSPYSPWVKVNFNGVIGWMALITVQTQAILEALPIDYNVPPPPTPTREPGSFGNAFPDPNRGG